MVTIIFHPDPARIGNYAVLPEAGSAKVVVIGRHSPLFERAGEATGASGLDDGHISRSAIRLQQGARGVKLSKLQGACRCRVAGDELGEDRAFTEEQLDRGVSVFLGHSVVLLLRRTVVNTATVGVVPPAGDQMIGSSAYMRALRQQIEQVSQLSADVLITGETGSGKELVAQAIHENSARAGRPMVAVNMAAITPSLAPALLFGAARGAYTGASGANAGYFEQAEGGSLFLDEVGDTPQEIQPQLLRALQQREIQPVGGTTRRVDVRIISATDADLDSAETDFKMALRHRLGAAQISVLPLSSHPEDMGELARFFLQKSCLEQGKPDLLPAREADQTAIALWAELFHLLLRHPWPGNVRQLANVISQVVLASDSVPRLSPELERELINAPKSEVKPSIDKSGSTQAFAQPGPEDMRSALEEADYQVTVAAKQLGITRQSVYRFIEQSPDLRLAADVPLEELQNVLQACSGNLALAAVQLKVSLHGLRSRLRESRHATLKSALT